jgi:putative peptidoglycan lipid II flippase
VILALRPFTSRLRLSWSWRQAGVASMFGLVPVVLLARGVDHGNQVLMRAIATTLPTGSVSALGYAWAIFQVPGILGASLATVVFPQFSEKLAARRTDELVSQTVTCIKVLLLLSGALATGLVTLGVPLVQVLLERGLFRHSDTLLTGGVVACYGIAVLVTSVNGVVGNLFWSLRRVKTRVALEAGAIAAGLVAAFLLAPALGAAGLALATSGMYLLLTGAGVFILAGWILPSPRWKDLVPAAGKTLVGCAAMGAAAGASRLAEGFLGLHPAAVLALGGVLGIGAYFVVGWWLQRQVLNLILAALFRRKARPGTAGLPAPETAPLSGTGACEVGR